MSDWRRGGWTGSIRKWVQREVRGQLRENSAAQRSSYGRIHRIVRRFFSIETFGRFLALYFIINFGFLLAEAALAKYAPEWLPSWTASGPPGADLKVLVLNVSSYLITAQVGVLGVISLALALVTLIAQRESSSTDVKVYYHESMAFEVVASSVALLFVLCLQLLWPTQFLIHRFGIGTHLLAFKFGLLGLHYVWLFLNLSGLAHFISTTFDFVQQSARERLRERYTANVVQPLEIAERLRQQIYGAACNRLIGDDLDENAKLPSASFGFDFGNPYTVELLSKFDRPRVLYDVRITWVRWVLRRWSVRCCKAREPNPSLFCRTWMRWAPNKWSSRYCKSTRAALAGSPEDQQPLIWFTPQMDLSLQGSIGWCRRRGGVPLSRVEKLVLRRAFRFRGTKHAA